MLTATQQRLGFIATVAAAVFGGVQLWPSFASLYKPETIAPGSNTAFAPGGVAISSGSLGTLPANGATSTQVTINNSDPAALEFLKREVERNERQKQTAQSLEAKLIESERSLQIWQFRYFHSSYPASVEMLQDLAALQNYEVRREDFDSRWADRISSTDARRTYINDVLLAYGWAVEQDGLLRISEKGSLLLRNFGISVMPYRGGNVEKPSFDCNKADKWYEKLICSDSELAALDLEMARLFRQLKSHSTDEANALNASQAEWRKNVRNVCRDRACLIDGYTARIKQLRVSTTP